MEHYEIELSHLTWVQIHELVLEISRVEELNPMRLLVLEYLEKLIPHRKSFFDLGYQMGGETVFFQPISKNMTGEELDAYSQYYEKSDYMGWMLPGKEGVFYRDSEIITDLARERTQIYRDWMQPMGVHYGAGCTLFYEGILFGSITMFRGREKDFTQKEIQILRIISEHLTRRLFCLFPKGFHKMWMGDCDSTLMDRYGTTTREKEIITLIGRGYSNKEIGQKLFISENTVKKHSSSIFHKCNVRNRTQLLQLLFHTIE